MGLRSILRVLFGDGRNVAAEMVEVFRPNAEASEQRAFDARAAALAQLAAERGARGIWGGFVDGLNRLPRPALAFGTIGLFVYAMAEPVGFAERMVGLGYVPDPLWWILGAIVTFYFGARELHHARNSGVAAGVRDGLRTLADIAPEMRALSDQIAASRPAPEAASAAPVPDGEPAGLDRDPALRFADNPALAAWAAAQQENGGADGQS
jgi:hypothetical protein